MRDRPAKLVIVCGLPGSGKTTHAKLLEKSLAAVRFCPDEWLQSLSLSLWDEERRAGIEAIQWELAQKLLECATSVIIEWGTWARAERDALRLRARDIGVGVDLHYLSQPIDVLIERIKRRQLEFPPVTRAQLLQWAEVFQEPSPGEMSLYDECLYLDASCP